MARFCPLCGGLLRFSLFNSTSGNSMSCPSCPYTLPITTDNSFKTLSRGRMDDNGDNSQIFMDSTVATCPKCSNDKAFYYQVQIRSADEPSSIFYKCCRPSCSYQWREG